MHPMKYQILPNTKLPSLMKSKYTIPKTKYILPNTICTIPNTKYSFLHGNDERPPSGSLFNEF